MNVVEIVFSPTGGTEKVAHIIGKQWSEKPAIIDLSDAKADFSKCKITEQDMVLVAMPSFGGRAPAVAISRLKQIAGNGAKCTLVCVYGNRAYEDTLVEMEDTAKECGFQVVAAIAAVAEHSIMPQYAAGRPDATDQKQLTDYANQIADKAGIVSAIPGNRPYKKAGGAGLVPKPDKSCVKCGACAETCPVHAIDPVNFTADSKACISCMRCMKQCPKNARKVNGMMVSVAALAIKKACSVRKENELFL
ncbi:MULTISPECIES: 4Fe-4S binding protein [unclassified Ruminococcus]|uniref:4Fe-4S binding protein n=1 Tax=unclassified Ruminococcus TaxID=2608920 RepID=UPI002108A16D|nr:MULTISPECIES: 4Fe-4S binding protein [unclassified Ruminococcus]MCQ4022925.1 4Fe-4S ferredoxin [Ruminococcus sp. zg-924]MCQ4115259.1 4Fe-4S ferredoxin [Ruminococcus sp. zg-921]